MHLDLFPSKHAYHMHHITIMDSFDNVIYQIIRADNSYIFQNYAKQKEKSNSYDSEMSAHRYRT